MESREKIIEQIISIPNNVRLSGTKSPVQCLRETGYKDLGGKIDVSEIILALLANPDVVESWFVYSADQRSGNGWYVIEQQTQFEVGYYSKEGFKDIKIYDDKLRACAEFIHHELPILIKIAET